MGGVYAVQTQLAFTGVRACRYLNRTLRNWYELQKLAWNLQNPQYRFPGAWLSQISFYKLVVLSPVIGVADFLLSRESLIFINYKFFERSVFAFIY